MIILKNIKQNLYIILILLIVLLIFTFMIFNLFYNNIEYVVKDRLNINLPKNSEVIYFEHNLLDGIEYVDYVKAKIKINKDSLGKLKNNMNDTLGESYQINNFDGLIPNFKNTYTWFCVDESNIVEFYHSYRTDHKFNDKHMHEIWAFICLEDGEYYLYLSF